jgi:hypothetical protein
MGGANPHRQTKRVAPGTPDKRDRPWYTLARRDQHAVRTRGTVEHAPNSSPFAG